MAITSLALIKLAQLYKDDIQDQINRNAKALSVVPTTTGSGANSAWVISTGGAAAEFYNEAADVSVYTSDEQKDAVLPWAQIRHNFGVSGLSRAAAQTAQNPSGNADLFARHLRDASRAIAKRVNQAIFTGANGATPTEIVGLQDAIGKRTNTYAGIDRTQPGNASFLPYVANPGTPTTLTLDAIRLDLREIMKASGNKPDIAFVSPDTFAVVSKLFDNGRSYNVDTASPALVHLEGGTNKITFDGCTFVEDVDAVAVADGYGEDGAGVIYYVQSEAWELSILPKASTPQLDPGTMMPVDSGFGDIPLGLTLEYLAVTGDARKVTLSTYLQQRILRPNACGTRFNISLS